MNISQYLYMNIGDPITFAGRKYQFDHVLETNIGTGYVPDWDADKAYRESYQNAIDEAFQSGGKLTAQTTDRHVYLRDGGRGVGLEDILLIGYSGKRGQSGVIGQHGEGEIVSFAVAARNNLLKMMASQNWLAVGRLEGEGARERLVLDVYKTRTERKGTAWLYVNRTGNTSMAKVHERAARAFRYHIYHKRTHRILTDYDQRGIIYTRGQRVCEISGMMYGYNLDITPGRDRAKFSDSEIRAELEKILPAELNIKTLTGILADMLRNGQWITESHVDFDLPEDIVRKAVRSATGSNAKNAVVWGRNNTPEVIDARDSGCRVLSFYNSAIVPTWILNNIPSATEAVQSFGGVTMRTPRPLDRAAEIALRLLDAGDDVSFVSVKSLGGDAALASCNQHSGQIKLRPSRIKRYILTGEAFLGLMAHEVAHYTTQDADCSRSHTEGIQRLMAGATKRIATDEVAREEFNKMCAIYDKWISSPQKEASGGD
jgi:hypothetical protein